MLLRARIWYLIRESSTRDHIFTDLYHVKSSSCSFVPWSSTAALLCEWGLFLCLLVLPLGPVLLSGPPLAPALPPDAMSMIILHLLKGNRKLEMWKGMSNSQNKLIILTTCLLPLQVVCILTELYSILCNGWLGMGTHKPSLHCGLRHNYWIALRIAWTSSIFTERIAELRTYGECEHAPPVQSEGA